MGVAALKNPFRLSKRMALRRRPGNRRSDSSRRPRSELDIAEKGILQGTLVAILVLGVLMLYLAATKTAAENFSLAYLNEQAFTPKAAQGQPFSFSFTIENHEGREALYRYVVTQDGTPVRSKDVMLADGEAYVASEHLPPISYTPSRVRVQVFKDHGADFLELYFTVTPA